MLFMRWFLTTLRCLWLECDDKLSAVASCAWTMSLQWLARLSVTSRRFPRFVTESPDRLTSRHMIDWFDSSVPATQTLKVFRILQTIIAEFTACLGSSAGAS